MTAVWERWGETRTGQTQLIASFDTTSLIFLYGTRRLLNAHIVARAMFQSAWSETPSPASSCLWSQCGEIVTPSSTCHRPFSIPGRASAACLEWCERCRGVAVPVVCRDADVRSAKLMHNAVPGWSRRTPLETGTAYRSLESEDSEQLLKRPPQKQVRTAAENRMHIAKVVQVTVG